MGALLQNIDKVECNGGKVAINCILEAYFVKLFQFSKGQEISERKLQCLQFSQKYNEKKTIIAALKVSYFQILGQKFVKFFIDFLENL